MAKRANGEGSIHQRKDGRWCPSIGIGRGRRKHFLGNELAISPNAVMLQQEADLVAALRDTPYSIGAFSLAYAMSNNLPLNKLSLDGVAPSAEEVLVGRYKLLRTLGIVWKSRPTPHVKQWIDFVLSDTGAEELLKNGFVPSTKS